jgi:hypothetical protein
VGRNSGAQTILQKVAGVRRKNWGRAQFRMSLNSLREDAFPELGSCIFHLCVSVEMKFAISVTQKDTAIVRLLLGWLGPAQQQTRRLGAAMQPVVIWGFKPVGQLVAHGGFLVYQQVRTVV